MKKRYKFVICLAVCSLIVIGLIVGVVLGFKFLLKDIFSMNNDPAYICPNVTIQQSSSAAITNHYQSNSNVKLSAWNSQLYFYATSPINGPYEHSLSVFEEGTVKTIEDWSKKIYLGSIDGYVYYCKNEDYLDPFDVYAYALDTQEETYLLSAYFNNNDLQFTPDGCMYFPANPEANSFYVVQGNKIIGHKTTEWVYQVGERQYTLKKYNNNELICVNDNIKENLNGVISYGSKVLFPYNNGLLIYNEGYEDLLYYLNSSGQLSLLFSVECISLDSSMCLYKDYIFLSFVRYEKWGDFGRRPFENDTLVGTYRIDLRNNSVTKISDSIYRGLYAFGDDGIYAVDRDGQIFLIDYDGNIIKELLLY